VFACGAGLRFTSGLMYFSCALFEVCLLLCVSCLSQWRWLLWNFSVTL
jgi:hypothetical protein